VGSIRYLIFATRSFGHLLALRLSDVADRKRLATDLLLGRLPATVNHDDHESSVDKKNRSREEA
jgi:hypothetical protein